MPYRKIQYRITYSVAADARVTRDQFARCATALERAVATFNARHDTSFACRTRASRALRVRGLSFATGAPFFEFPRKHGHRAAMQSLRRAGDAARKKVAALRQKQASADYDSDVHRRTAKAIAEVEDAHRGVLQHDFSRIHTTVALERARAPERLFLRCVLCLAAQWLPQLELDFFESGRAQNLGTMRDTMRLNAPRSVRRELSHCAYLTSRRTCASRQCEWNAEESVCEEKAGASERGSGGGR